MNATDICRALANSAMVKGETPERAKWYWSLADWWAKIVVEPTETGKEERDGKQG